MVMRGRDPCAVHSSDEVCGRHRASSQRSFILVKRMRQPICTKFVTRDVRSHFLFLSIFLYQYSKQCHQTYLEQTYLGKTLSSHRILQPLTSQQPIIITRVPGNFCSIHNVLNRPDAVPDVHREGRREGDSG